MDITKAGHASVRITRDDAVLVVDPGVLTDPGTLTGATAVLVTHEHADHFSEEALRQAAAADPALEVWTTAAVARQLDGLGGRVHVVGDGDTFEAAGFQVEAHGQWHAVLHADVPRITNVGFLVDGRVFHPGDALTVPAGAQVETLLLPVHGPWSRTGELVDYVRELRPQQVLAVHDGALNDVGRAMVGGLLGAGGPGTGAEYLQLAPGETVGLG